MLSFPTVKKSHRVLSALPVAVVTTDLQSPHLSAAASVTALPLLSLGDPVVLEWGSEELPSLPQLPLFGVSDC